jgi:hypothetical protein
VAHLLLSNTLWLLVGVVAWTSTVEVVVEAVLVVF